MVNNKKIFETACSLLMKKEYFSSFKILKSKNQLFFQDKIRKRKDRLEFGFYSTVETEHDIELSIIVDVLLSVRFDILFKWAEKFYHNQDDLSTFREHSNVFDLLMLNHNAKELYLSFPTLNSKKNGI